MKKSYIKPQVMVDFAQCAMLVAASLLDVDSDSQSITPSNDEFDGEFSSKEYSFDD
ncbi:MAG: hypothetical protein IKO73_01730 [Bacteroidaceae bacterium]|nr:hypothetical protein [Bacteroidaceae bacterium]